jgi:hypothetical protein
LVLTPSISPDIDGDNIEIEERSPLVNWSRWSKSPRGGQNLLVANRIAGPLPFAPFTGVPGTTSAAGIPDAGHALAARQEDLRHLNNVGLRFHDSSEFGSAWVAEYAALPSPAGPASVAAEAHGRLHWPCTTIPLSLNRSTGAPL